jgi:hypothetical protein
MRYEDFTNEANFYKLWTWAIVGNGFALLKTKYWCSSDIYPLMRPWKKIFVNTLLLLQS